MPDRIDTEEIDFKALDYPTLKRLLAFLKPYKKFVYFSIFLIIITSVLSPIRPYLSKIAIDKYIANKDWYGLIDISLIIFGTLILNAVFQFFLTYLMQWIGQKALFDIRKNLYSHIMKMSMSFIDKNPVGRLVTRVTNDVEALNQLFSAGVIMIFADFLLLFWILCFMFYTSWQLALITMLVIPPLIIVSLIFRKKVRSIYRVIRQQISKMNTFLNEFISGIMTVKLFSQEKMLSAKFDEINLKHNQLQMKTIMYYSLFFPVIEMLSAATLGLILWYSGISIISNGITVGVVIAFMQYAEMFFRPIRDLTEKYTTLQSAMASAERIFTTLDTTSFVEDKPDSIQFTDFVDKIEFKNVSFSYDATKEVLRNVSFEINKGDIVAIVGATGAGKTSIVNLLCRFYDYNSGNILIDGVDIRNYEQKSLRKKIGIVMQDVFIFSRTISDNISLGEDMISEDKVRSIARLLGAESFIEKLDGGYMNHLIERGDSLSLGQKQLLSFCRALAFNSPILILDEATSSIDSETEADVVRALETLLTDRTSIIIAHRLSTIKRANKIIVMHHGEVRETGTHDELIKMNGIYTRLYKLQYQNLIAV